MSAMLRLPRGRIGAQSCRALLRIFATDGAADPLTYATIVPAVGALALLASYLPARRAARVSPARVLRSE